MFRLFPAADRVEDRKVNLRKVGEFFPRGVSRLVNAAEPVEDRKVNLREIQSSSPPDIAILCHPPRIFSAPHLAFHHRPVVSAIASYTPVSWGYKKSRRRSRRQKAHRSVSRGVLGW